jgi:two-component system sensor histidine kinase CreC
MPSAERTHFLNNILNQNARQKQLIDKLLDLVRVEKQQKLSAPERVRLTALCAQAAQDVELKAAARQLRIELALDDVEVTGDALLLRQALGNLLDNAIDFSPPGGTVWIGAARAGDAVLVTVRDSGAGIPAFARGRLFERFYSLPRADGARSTGLGLPFVREVAALHGGAVDVDNDPRGGGCAVLRLPA